MPHIDFKGMHKHNLTVACILRNKDETQNELILRSFLCYLYATEQEEMLQTMVLFPNTIINSKDSH